MSDLIVGIDLGTTNSEVAAFVDGQVKVLGAGGRQILPSCVGFSATGELLVGEAARNQQALYPERTVRSIKRRMGNPETVIVGGRNFTPQEISALILRELAEWARASLGELPQKAVITVPAYFSAAQIVDERRMARSVAVPVRQAGVRVRRRIAPYGAHLRSGRRHLR